MRIAALAFLTVIGGLICFAGLPAAGNDRKTSVPSDSKAKLAAADAKSTAKAVQSPPTERVVEDPAAVKKAINAVSKEQEEFDKVIRGLKEKMDVLDRADWNARTKVWSSIGTGSSRTCGSCAMGF